jgi:hypothetical protein
MTVAASSCLQADPCPRSEHNLQNRPNTANNLFALCAKVAPFFLLSDGPKTNILRRLIYHSADRSSLSI